MAISPTSTSSQSSSDQALSTSSTGAHRRYQVSNRTSERQPAVIENESFARIPGFFERIANRFKNWKENRSQAAVNKSAKTAGSDILNGLSNNNFKKVHQGLKRLHNAERKLSDMGALNERHYIEKALERVINDLHAHKFKPDDPEMPIIPDDCNELIDRYSDKKTSFHRMLTNLDKVGLISSSYVSSRTQRINDLDGSIKDSFEFLKVLWKEKAGDTGAMVELGVRHYHGKGGVRQDKAKAIDLWQRAEKAENPAAMAQLGRCYFYGKGGVRQDQAKAIDLWQKAEKAENPAAMVLLGRCYYDGLGGLDQNQAKAVELWQKAVKAENPAAMYELGRCYYDGVGGLHEDKAKAINLWHRAVDGRNTKAMFQLGCCYYDGVGGVDKDQIRGVDLWQRAAAAGHPDARNMLARLARLRTY